MFRPTGSVIQLMDGRIFKRNQRNLWEDINTGVTITENQLSLMVSSASFSTTASGGGGKTNKPVRFVPDYTATQQEWDDINAATDNVEIQNTNKQILGINAPIEIRLQFNTVNAIYGANSSLKVYKNNILIDTISTNTRPTKTGDGQGFYTLSETFSNGNNLKFGVISDFGVLYQVTVLNKTTSEVISQSSFAVTVTGFG